MPSTCWRRKAPWPRCPKGCRRPTRRRWCAPGVTTFNALRNSGARPGDTVAILGLGGLGHLGVQYAAKLGFRTVAIARGKDKEPLAKKLGASTYIDSQAGDPAEALAKLGGATAILATVANGEAMSALQGGLAVNGTMLLIGAVPAMQINPILLLLRCASVKGWYSGTSIDSQDTLAFSACRRAIDERGGPLRASQRGLRADDQRQSPVPDGVEDRPSSGARF